MSPIAWDYEVGLTGTGYLSAELCLNGHVITSDVAGEEELTAKFCPECGAKTIRVCPNPECNAAIRGYQVIDGGVGLNYASPNHCHNCGAAFPWTTAKIAAAKEHAGEIEGLDAAEREQLQEAIGELAAGGPRTELATSRFKRLMKKVGKPAASGLYKLVLDVATEAAKKAITQQLPW